MTLRTQSGGRKVAETVEDLQRWLVDLPGLPEPLRTTRQIACADPRHDSPSTWLYVMADPHEGVACWRCVACSRTGWLADSQERWTHPMMWSCSSCQQSLAELVLGTAGEPDGPVSWALLAARCPDCGTLEGLTDVVYAAPDAAALLG